mgnify:CR=1 FL=1
MTTSSIQKAAEMLRSGGLIAFPTETVYGLGADARNEQAIRRIFAVKRRPLNHPLIVHLGQKHEISKWAREVSDVAHRLMESFWPGPLTLVFKRNPDMLDLIAAHQDTVALRMPDHPVALALLSAFGDGVVAPSANRFTHVSPTTAQGVSEELGDDVDFILDGGACAIGLESTIVDVSCDPPTILRPGMITAEEISVLLGQPIGASSIHSIRVPGQHRVHYAPKTLTKVMNIQDLAAMCQPIIKQRVVALIREFNPSNRIANIVWYRMPKDAEAYAHTLYQTLRDMDKKNYDQIIIENVPMGSKWLAISDRLKKASRD